MWKLFLMCSCPHLCTELQHTHIFMTFFANSRRSNWLWGVTFYPFVHSHPPVSAHFLPLCHHLAASLALISARLCFSLPVSSHAVTFRVPSSVIILPTCLDRGANFSCWHVWYPCVEALVWHQLCVCVLSTLGQSSLFIWERGLSREADLENVKTLAMWGIIRAAAFTALELIEACHLVWGASC